MLSRTCDAMCTCDASLSSVALATFWFGSFWAPSESNQKCGCVSICGLCVWECESTYEREPARPPYPTLCKPHAAISAVGERNGTGTVNNVVKHFSNIVIRLSNRIKQAGAYSLWNSHWLLPARPHPMKRQTNMAKRCIPRFTAVLVGTCWLFGEYATRL